MTVKALCDVYGRFFTLYDSSNDIYDGVAWNDEGLDKTFDSFGEREEAFLALIQTFGHNDAVTSVGVENVVININGTLTDFVFENGRCVPVPSLWQQGSTNTLFYRALNDGTDVITVICDSDGKLVVSSGDSYYEYLVASDQIREADANLNALIAAAGGSVVADVFSDNDGNYLLISLDGYTVVADLDGILALGNIPAWVRPRGLYLRANDMGPSNYLVSETGMALHFKYGDNRSFYMCNVNDGHYSIESGLPPGWAGFDIPFNGESYSDGSFVYNGITYTCVNNVMSPVVNSPYAS